MELLQPERMQNPWQGLLRELENRYVDYERYFEGGRHFVKEKDQKYYDLVRRIKDIHETLISAGQRPQVEALLERRKIYLAQLKNKHQRG